MIWIKPLALECQEAYGAFASLGKASSRVPHPSRCQVPELKK